MNPEAPRRMPFWEALAAARDGLWGLLVWIWNWCWGNNLPPGGREDGLRESITLFGFLLAWQAALLAYIQANPNPEFKVVAVYLIVSAVPLIGIFSICTARNDNSATHFVRSFHRRVGWRLGIISAFLVVGLAFSYLRGILPGQYVTGTYLDTGTKLLGVNLERDSCPVATSTWRASLSVKWTPKTGHPDKV